MSGNNNMTETISHLNSLPKGLYTIQDNGIRCFVPPCFSWNVLDHNGQLVTTVSEVDISSLGGSIDKSIIQASLVGKGLCVTGYSIPLPESNGVRQGIRFVAERLEAPQQKE